MRDGDGTRAGRRRRPQPAGKDSIRRGSDNYLLRLLRAHPELAGKEAEGGTLTAASTSEQKGAGLVNLNPAEKARIAELNRAYRARHGFPFIIAVRNYTRAQIFSRLQ